jgi:hypothetical protein
MNDSNPHEFRRSLMCSTALSFGHPRQTHFVCCCPPQMALIATGPSWAYQVLTSSTVKSLLNSRRLYFEARRFGFNPCCSSYYVDQFHRPSTG